MTDKPRLGFWQIWNMSFGFLGIQFGFALQNANVSRIFQYLNADVGKLSLYWLAAPVTGLLVQPIIGHYSDKTWNRLGRRRPYFLAGAILASIALIIMPNSPALWIAVGMLWIMDGSINISMEPFRAFVGDMLPADQRTTGFSMQSFFIGIGAVIASILPWVMTNWLGIANSAEVGQIPPSVRIAFYLGAAVFFLAVLWTVVSTKEYSPEQLEKFNSQSNEKQADSEKEAIGINNKTQHLFYKVGKILLILGIILTLALYFAKATGEVYILSIGLIGFGLFEFISGFLYKTGKNKNGLVEIIEDLNNMPSTMKQLAIVQFFSWFALFAMWIYTTPAITSHIYGTTDTSSELYGTGANWVGVCFGVYNGFAAIFAFLLILIAKLTNRKITHMISLIAGGFGFISIYFAQDPNQLLLSFIGIGLAWASILAMPYAILTGSIPAKKMGIYMGIFNFFIVIPQITAATILGFITKTVFNGDAIYTLVLGGCSLFIAALAVVFVEDKYKKYGTSIKSRSLENN